jgi:hypothetical protein
MHLKSFFLNNWLSPEKSFCKIRFSGENIFFVYFITKACLYFFKTTQDGYFETYVPADFEKKKIVAWTPIISNLT